MKPNWLITVAGAAALFAAGAACADHLSPEQLDPLVKSGRVLPLDKLMDAALLEHEGGHIKEGQIEASHGGYIYKVEVTDRKGEDW
ncbi:MAG TPA: hypothetical protein VJ696_12405, partial [Rhodanobacteraceae bacterium]|nr:hypothetical protein [Rhodanobacteraceae bacterium]